MGDVSLYQKYKNFLNGAAEVCAIIAVVALTFMMLITTLDVICRMLGVTLLGAFELVEFSMAIIVPLAIAYCEKLRQHICVNLIVKHFPKPSQPWFDLITSIITFILYFIIAYESYLNTVMFIDNNMTSPVLRWPSWLFTLPCIFGFFLTALLLINHCVNVIRQIRDNSYNLA